MRRLLTAAVLVAALALAPAASALRLRSGDGLHVTAVAHVDPRLIAVTVTTAALPKPAHVDILLPVGYAAHPHRRYPVLYLLHGTSGTASDWTTLGGAEATIGNRPLITVMPDIDLDGDGGGWCTDWPNGAERWETFHIDELVPWIDANLRTLPVRAQRAIAGLSQGGFCALSYAARHPDLFSVALAYSGAPDIYADPAARAGARAIINATEVGLDHVPPNTFFGDPTTDAINWAAHDPATLDGNLRATRLSLYWGNGLPGPLDTPATLGAGGIESLVAADNAMFETRLHGAGIPARFDAYGPGTHSWPYWARDLRWSIGQIVSDFAHPAPTPHAFSYTSDAGRYSVYGWTVRMHRPVVEFSTLAVAGRTGFALSGSGTATVLSAPIYAPGVAFRVRLHGTRVRAHTIVLVARRDGRLDVPVTLGPANRGREDSPGVRTRVYRTTVSIRPA